MPFEPIDYLNNNSMYSVNAIAAPLYKLSKYVRYGVLGVLV